MFVSQPKSIFGVPIPDGAVKASIKPLLGRGQSKAMWQGAIEKDGIYIDECDIITDVADNVAFWSYIDLQVQAKRITAKDGVWPFRVIVSFEDQAGVRTEGAQSSEDVEFVRRSGSGATSQADQSFVRMLSLVEKLTMELPKVLHEQTMQHHERVTAAGLKVIEESGKNAAAQAAGIIQSTQAPLQATIDSINKAFEQERNRYDSSIKLNMRMLETKKTTNIFDDVAKLAPLAPIVMPAINKLLN